jgi:hypothetical protein
MNEEFTEIPQRGRSHKMDDATRQSERVLVIADDGAVVKVLADINLPGLDRRDAGMGSATEVNEERVQEGGLTKPARKPLSPDLIQMISAEALVRRHDEAIAASASEVEVEVEVEAVPEAPTGLAVSSAPPKVNVAKNIALFFAAPFIGLAYLVAFPFIGIGIVVAAIVRKRQKTDEPSDAGEAS